MLEAAAMVRPRATAGRRRRPTGKRARQPCGPPRKSQRFCQSQLVIAINGSRGSAALRVAAVQAGHAAVHHDDRRSAAAAAQLRAFREVRLGEGIGLPGTRLELGALFIDQLLLVSVELTSAYQTD